MKTYPSAQALGVGESGVLTALSDGSSKGKKIGATSRIEQETLDEFLKN